MGNLNIADLNLTVGLGAESFGFDLYSLLSGSIAPEVTDFKDLFDRINALYAANSKVEVAIDKILLKAKWNAEDELNPALNAISDGWSDFSAFVGISPGPFTKYASEAQKKTAIAAWATTTLNDPADSIIFHIGELEQYITGRGVMASLSSDFINNNSPWTVPNSSLKGTFELLWLFLQQRLLLAFILRTAAEGFVDRMPKPALAGLNAAQRAKLKELYNTDNKTAFYPTPFTDQAQQTGVYTALKSSTVVQNNHSQFEAAWKRIQQAYAFFLGSVNSDPKHAEITERDFHSSPFWAYLSETDNGGYIHYEQVYAAANCVVTGLSFFKYNNRLALKLQQADVDADTPAPVPKATDQWVEPSGWASLYYAYANKQYDRWSADDVELPDDYVVTGAQLDMNDGIMFLKLRGTKLVADAAGKLSLDASTHTWYPATPPTKKTTKAQIPVTWSTGFGCFADLTPTIANPLAFIVGGHSGLFGNRVCIKLEPASIRYEDIV